MLKISIFGKPCLTDSKDRIIYFKNSKEMAILAYLVRQDERLASREQIAETLWSQADTKKRQASLRQVVKKLRELERGIGVRFLEISNRVIGLNEGAIRSDLDEINDALSKGTKHSIAKAQRLIAPNIFEGLDHLDPEFEKWRLTEARIIRGRLLERAAVRLSYLPNALHPCFPAFTRFMLKVDPSYEWAHQRLIQHYMVSGENERAHRQFDDCEATLLRELGMRPQEETKKVLSTGVPPSEIEYTHSAKIEPPPLRRADVFPVINILHCESPEKSKQSANLLLEFAEQIGRNRELVVQFSPTVTDVRENVSGPVGIDDHAGGQFTLNVRDLGNGNGAQVELRSRREGQSVYYDALPIHNRMSYEDRVGVIGRSIVAMQNDMRTYYKRSREMFGTTYRKLSVVYDLIRKFDAGANTEALNTLAGLGSGMNSSSLIYAFKATLYLQQNLFLKVTPDSGFLLRDARAMAAKAIELDPWHALNHRYLSFAACYSGRVEEAKQHILIGQSLSPSDPLQTIATAEVCAFSGDVAQALRLVEYIFKFGGKLPRYSYGYLANIQFAAGNFEEAARLAQQAPAESMDYRATRIASLWQLGRKDEARSEMGWVMDSLVRQHSTTIGFSKNRICDWLSGLSPFSDERIKAIYRSGIVQAACM